MLQYYTPFGLLLAADTLFDLATALRFDPVVFEPGQQIITSSERGELDKLSTLLTERPGVHLTLCGISNRADAGELYPDVLKVAEKSETRKMVLNDVQTKALLQLAERRGHAVKDYLVGQKKIDAGRLIVCEPEYQEDADRAVVEISI